MIGAHGAKHSQQLQKSVGCETREGTKPTIDVHNPQEVYMLNDHTHSPFLSATSQKGIPR